MKGFVSFDLASVCGRVCVCVWGGDVGCLEGVCFPISVSIISKYLLDICKNKTFCVRQYSYFRKPPNICTVFPKSVKKIG